MTSRAVFGRCVGEVLRFLLKNLRDSDMMIDEGGYFIGITDPLTIQIKGAAFQVRKGEKTVDDVVKLYGTYE